DYKPAITIRKIYFDNYYQINVSIVKIVRGTSVSVSGTNITLPQGTEAYIRVEFNVDPHSVHPDLPGKKEINIMTNEGFLSKSYAKIIIKDNS
ncbi:MAG: hypothetical protein F7C35_06255, partial [Desulfurococcales archaeon]|nr:hypothetical protein [Desulfurococcales archaeon]